MSPAEAFVTVAVGVGLHLVPLAVVKRWERRMYARRRFFPARVAKEVRRG